MIFDLAKSHFSSVVAKDNGQAAGQANETGLEVVEEEAEDQEVEDQEVEDQEVEDQEVEAEEAKALPLPPPPPPARSNHRCCWRQ